MSKTGISHRFPPVTGCGGPGARHQSGQCTWYEFARAIVQETGLSVPVLPITTEQAGRTAQRPRYSVLNQDRLISLGFVPPFWKAALKEFMSAHRFSLALTK